MHLLKHLLTVIFISTILTSTAEAQRETSGNRGGRRARKLQQLQKARLRRLKQAQNQANAGTAIASPLVVDRTNEAEGVGNNGVGIIGDLTVGPNGGSTQQMIRAMGQIKSGANGNPAQNKATPIVRSISTPCGTTTSSVNGQSTPTPIVRIITNPSGTTTLTLGGQNTPTPVVRIITNPSGTTTVSLGVQPTPPVRQVVKPQPVAQPQYPTGNPNPPPPPPPPPPQQNPLPPPPPPSPPVPPTPASSPLPPNSYGNPSPSAARRCVKYRKKSTTGTDQINASPSTTSGNPSSPTNSTPTSSGSPAQQTPTGQPAAGGNAPQSPQTADNTGSQTQPQDQPAGDTAQQEQNVAEGEEGVTGSSGRVQVAKVLTGMVVTVVCGIVLL